MEEIKIKYFGLYLSKKHFLIVYSIYILITLLLFIYFTNYPLNKEKIPFLQPFLSNYFNYFFVIILLSSTIERQLFWNEYAKKQVQKIETLKLEVEIKSEEINSSIRYASRIQKALLTSEMYLQWSFSKSLMRPTQLIESTDYFIFFKPKDIVSGDFYWARNNMGYSAKEGQFQTLFIACCDSTGHGVPGAFMSLLNISFLNESLNYYHQSKKPDEILNNVRTNVVNALNPDGGTESKDGMDAVLFEIDFNTNMLYASCANNPLWIIAEGKLVEIKPDKMPVGYHDKMNTPFTLHSRQLNKGDTVYTFTDGYADQFGGSNNKKFKYSQLKDLIMKIYMKPLKEQKEILQTTFENWKGEEEQVDDVLIIGVRI